MLKRSLLLLGALAGCRAVGAPTDRVAPTPEVADRAAAPASDVEFVVEVIPLQRASADALVCLILSGDSRGVARWNENRYCALPLPWTGAVITPPDDTEWKELAAKRAPASQTSLWSVDVLAHQNALVLRGTPAQVMSLRQLVLRLDRRY